MPAARLPRWVNRHLPRGSAPHIARRYAEPRGALLLTTGATYRGVNLRRRSGVNFEHRLTDMAELADSGANSTALCTSIRPAIPRSRWTAYNRASTPRRSGARGPAALRLVHRFQFPLRVRGAGRARRAVGRAGEVRRPAPDQGGNLAGHPDAGDSVASRPGSPMVPDGPRCMGRGRAWHGRGQG